MWKEAKKEKCISFVANLKLLKEYSREPTIPKHKGVKFLLPGNQNKLWCHSLCLNFHFASKEIWADAYEEATLQILNFMVTMSNIEFAI